MKKLKDISSIITGHVFRSKIEYSANGNVNLLNMESISTAGNVALTGFDVKKIIAYDVKQDEIITAEDILFKAKGLNNTSVFIEKIPGNTTTTGSCLIIRVTDKNILPEYVCCWLNSEFAKKHYAMASGQATGVTIANVSKATLENLPIKIPNIESQRQIVEFANLGREEICLLEKIAKKRKLLNSIMLEKEIQKV